MSFNKIMESLPQMQQGQQQMLESVLKPRGKIAESPKNKVPGQRLAEFYQMNPNMRSGEFDPSGAKAQGRANFNTWQQDQADRTRGYGEISNLRRGVDSANGMVNGVPMNLLPPDALAGLMGGQGQGQGRPQGQGQPAQGRVNPQQTEVPFVGPLAPGQTQMPQMGQQQYPPQPMENGVRINRQTGLPFGYMPGDDLGQFSPEMQQTGSESIQRMNQNTQQEVGRRNQRTQNYNEFQAQNQPKPQMVTGPDGQLVPRAVPVQGADAAISADQFNDSMALDPMGYYADPNGAGIRMEYLRQQGQSGLSPSLAGDVSQPTPMGNVPRPLLDPGQYMMQDVYGEQQAALQEQQVMGQLLNMLAEIQMTPQGPPDGLASASEFFGLPLMGDGMQGQPEPRPGGIDTSVSATPTRQSPAPQQPQRQQPVQQEVVQGQTNQNRFASPQEELQMLLQMFAPVQRGISRTNDWIQSKRNL